jgi:signal transduction histidine kinase/putative methionine-R-sulfoxide reductase with GAF domain
MKCPRCQQHNPSHAMFCLQCGAPVRRSAADDASASYTELQRSLTEALARESATGEILRVLSGSPTAIQPVLDAIAGSAARLCGSLDANIFRRDGDQLVLIAHHGSIPIGPIGEFTVPMILGTAAGRAVLEGRAVHVADMQTRGEEFREGSEIARRHGDRTILAVPLIREGNAIGVIVLRRAESRLFTDRQVALLQTFADQAVIAIENVRLFKALEARNSDLTLALEQQTATSEILRVISSSPTDEQPVFDAIVRSARRLCEATYSVVFLAQDGQLTLAAVEGVDAAGIAAIHTAYPRPIARDTTSGRAILDRRLVHLEDSWVDPEYTHPLRNTIGLRSILTIPFFRDGIPMGALSVWRPDVRPFTEKQIALLQTFADQAVIAIENVRLFTELQARNKELTTALEQQTATSEVLRVIAAAQIDAQPVFDTIATNALRLCTASNCAVFRFDGELIHIVAMQNVSPEGVDAARQAFPMPPSRGGSTARAILTRDVVNIADVREDAEYQLQGMAAAVGFRSVLSVPMLREGNPIGAISVLGIGVAAFSDNHVELLKTFADQAVIAIENVRLFKELEARNRDLSETLAQQTATAEVLKVISRSTFDLEPVLETLIENAGRLCRADGGCIYRQDGELQRLAAAYNMSPEHRDFVERNPLSPGRGTAVGRAMLEGRAIHIHDVQADPSYTYSGVGLGSYRTLLGVPMMREGVPIGVFAVWRTEVLPFTDKQIELVTTFADQGAIAIENVRLFKELEARTQDLTRSVGELRALGDVSRALSSTLDVDVVLNTIVTRANDLIGADGCTIFEYDEVTEQFHLRATRNLEPRLVELARGTPLRKGDQGILGQLPIGRQAVQVPDITAGSYSSPISDALIATGYRAVVAVPLIREDHLIGALTMNRKTPGEFPAETIELLQTFATQSALAIQNARLFREIEQKSRELEAASRHKSEFLANMSHELRTPLNAVIGFSEVLSERMFGDLNEKQDEYLKDIHASGQHLLSLINDILDLSKIEAGRMELELSDFDLPMAIDNAMTLIRERAARRSITLHRRVDERLGQIQADERKIRQVLLNLLSNAIKFTSEGGRIEVGAKPVDRSIEMSVTDTGVGIAPEDQEAVFEEFRQVGTADKKVEGTGLGLALSRKFIELHGGRIWVKSEVGEGSTFTFTIPVRRGE